MGWITEEFFDWAHRRNDLDPKEISRILAQIDKMEIAIKKLKKNIEKLKP